MLSCARATRGRGSPSLDTRSGKPSSPPSREKIEERRSLRREKTPGTFSLFRVQTIGKFATVFESELGYRWIDLPLIVIRWLEVIDE